MFPWSSECLRITPLRAVRKLTDTVLRTLNAELDALYADSGRPSQPDDSRRGANPGKLIFDGVYPRNSER